MRESTCLPLTEDSTDTVPSNTNGKYFPGQMSAFICGLFHKRGIMPSSKPFPFIWTEKHFITSGYPTDHNVLQIILSRTLCMCLIYTTDNMFTSSGEPNDKQTYTISTAIGKAQCKSLFPFFSNILITFKTQSAQNSSCLPYTHRSKDSASW